jgi:hypothetical protein
VAGFAVIPIRLYVYAAIGLAIAGLIWHDRYQTKRADRLAAELSTATETLLAERENVRKANAASQAYQTDLARLESERRKPLSVRLCRSPAVPATRTASGPDAAPTGNVGEAATGDSGAAPDIGDQLLNYAIDAEANMLQLERLQGWVRGR